MPLPHSMPSLSRGRDRRVWHGLPVCVACVGGGGTSGPGREESPVGATGVCVKPRRAGCVHSKRGGVTRTTDFPITACNLEKPFLGSHVGRKCQSRGYNLSLLHSVLSSPVPPVPQEYLRRAQAGGGTLALRASPKAEVEAGSLTSFSPLGSRSPCLIFVSFLIIRFP